MVEEKSDLDLAMDMDFFTKQHVPQWEVVSLAKADPRLVIIEDRNDTGRPIGWDVSPQTARSFGASDPQGFLGQVEPQGKQTS